MSNLIHRRRRCARIVPYMILLPGGQYARGWRAEPLTRRGSSLWLHGSLFVLPTAAILFSGGLEGPAGQDWELRHRAAAKTRLEQRPMTEGPRRNVSSAHRNFLIYFLHKLIRLIRLIRGRTETSTGQGFILVYRLAMDAKTRKGDDVAD